MMRGGLIPVANPQSAAEVMANVRRVKRMFAEAEAQARYEDASLRREQQERERAERYAQDLKALEANEKLKIARDYILVSTPETAEGEFPQHVWVKRSKPSPSRLRLSIAKIERHYGLGYGDIFGPRRDTRTLRVRYFCVHLVSRLRPDWSLPHLGRFFGGRDHTTILHTLRSKSGKRPSWSRAMTGKRALP